MTDDATRDITFDAFAAGLSAGRPQVLVRRVIDDLETPVSAYLKLGRDSSAALERQRQTTSGSSVRME